MQIKLLHCCQQPTSQDQIYIKKIPERLENIDYIEMKQTKSTLTTKNKILHLNIIRQNTVTFCLQAAK